MHYQDLQHHGLTSPASSSPPYLSFPVRISWLPYWWGRIASGEHSMYPIAFHPRCSTGWIRAWISSSSVNTPLDQKNLKSGFPEPLDSDGPGPATSSSTGSEPGGYRAPANQAITDLSDSARNRVTNNILLLLTGCTTRGFLRPHDVHCKQVNILFFC